MSIAYRRNSPAGLFVPGAYKRPGRQRPLRRSLRADAALVFAAGLALLLALSALLTATGGLNWSFVPAAIIVYGAIAAIAMAGLGHHPHDRFGAPNVVTTLRAVATALFAGLVLDAGQIAGELREGWAWLFAALALAALMLDGIDGYLARRSGLSSAFGARFDMEVDALLIFLLSALAFALGKAGLFVLAIGLMRYAFLGAQLAFPWLGAELPASFRRKAVCVMQAAVLGAIVTPIVQPPVSNVAAGVTVLFLGWSFAVDTFWLYRNRSGRA